MKKFNELTKGSIMYVVDLYTSNIIEVPVTEVVTTEDTMNISYMMDGHIFTIYVKEKMNRWISCLAFGYCADKEASMEVMKLIKNTNLI